MDAEFVIGKVPKVIKIERIHASPVSGVTDDGEEVVEDNLHLELRNVGKKTLSFIDCTISYKDKKGATLGKDSDGSFDECKPKETYKFSIPFFVPEDARHNSDAERKHIRENIYMVSRFIGTIWFYQISKWVMYITNRSTLDGSLRLRRTVTACELNRYVLRRQYG